MRGEVWRQEIQKKTSMEEQKKAKEEKFIVIIVLSFVRKLAYQLTAFPTTLLLVLSGALHGSPEFAKGILISLQQRGAHSTHCVPISLDTQARWAPIISASNNNNSSTTQTQMTRGPRELFQNCRCDIIGFLFAQWQCRSNTWARAASTALQYMLDLYELTVAVCSFTAVWFHTDGRHGPDAYAMIADRFARL